MGEPSTRLGRWAARDHGTLTGRQRVQILVALILVSIAITAWTLYADAAESAHERDLLATGSRSHALVENVFSGTREDFVQVTILILDGDAEGYEVRVGLDPSTTVAVGDSIEVAYNSKEPGDLVLVGEPANPRNGLALGAWVIAALVGARFAWSTWKARASGSS